LVTFAVRLQTIVMRVFPIPRWAAHMVMEIAWTVMPRPMMRKYSLAGPMVSSLAPTSPIIHSAVLTASVDMTKASNSEIISDWRMHIRAESLSSCPFRRDTMAVTPTFMAKNTDWKIIRGCPVSPTAATA
jgi:hypothetical protein